MIELWYWIGNIPGDHGDVHEHVVGDGLGVHDDHDGHDHENPVDWKEKYRAKTSRFSTLRWFLKELYVAERFLGNFFVGYSVSAQKLLTRPSFGHAVPYFLRGAIRG